MSLATNRFPVPAMIPHLERLWGRGGRSSAPSARIRDNPHPIPIAILGAQRDDIQTISDRTGLSPVQAATIAALEREAELRAARTAAQRSGTSMELAPLSANDLRKAISHRSSGRRVSGPARRQALVAEVVCASCGGHGYYKLAVPYGHPQFGVLFPCACKLAEIAEKDAQILRELADELQRYRHCPLAAYGLDRPIDGELIWEGYTLTEDEQRQALLAAHATASAYKEQSSIRRGDLARLSDGQIVCVLSTRGGYIHTTAGTYAPWQIERLDKQHSCCAAYPPASAAPSSSSSSSTAGPTSADRFIHDARRRQPG